MLNRITIAGRLTKEPELRYAGKDNKPVASFTIACDRDIKDADGGKITDFFECVAWRGTAEFISKYFSQGRVIIVDGRMQTRKWEDKDGNKRKSYEVLVEAAYFGDSKRDGEEREPVKNEPVKSEPVKNAKPATSNGVFVEMDEDDGAMGELPF